MKNYISIFLCGMLLFLITTLAHSQDKVYLLDGTTFDGKITLVNDTVVEYEIETPKKIKFKVADSKTIYSIVYSNGQEQILYKPDSLKEGELSVEEMRFFIQGLSEANKTYKTTGTIIAGAALGAWSVLFFPISYLYPAIGAPLAYTGSHMLPFSKVKDESVVFKKEIPKNEKYILGYKEGARKKRIADAFKSSIAGVAFGIVTYMIVSPKF